MHVPSLVVTSPRSNCIVIRCLVYYCWVYSAGFIVRGNLSEALSTNRATAPANNSTELCDNIINSLTNTISDCEYIDVEDNNLNLTNEVDSLILLHLNIR